MKRAGDVKWGYVQIGAVVVAAIGFLLWASMKGGDSSFIFSKRISINAYFHNVKGLVEGAPVNLNGFEIGTVDRISFDKFDQLREIEVTASVSKSSWKYLRKDSQAAIVSVGFFGDKYLSMSAGSPELPQIADGGTIEADESPEMMEYLGAKNGAMSRLPSIMASLDTVAMLIAHGQGSVGKAFHDRQLYDQMVSLTGSLKTLSASLNQNQDVAVRSLVRTSNTMDSLGHALMGQGTIGRAMRDSSLYVHLNSAAARMDSLMGEINSGHGNIGKLTRDEAFYNELNATMKDVRNIMQDLQKNPKKYLKISVF